MYEYTIENMIDDGVEVEEKVKYEEDKNDVRCFTLSIVNIFIIIIEKIL